MIVSDSGSSGVAFGQFQFSLKKKKKREGRSHKSVGKDPRITAEHGIITQGIST